MFELPRFGPDGKPLYDANKQPVMVDLVLGPDGNPTFDATGQPFINVPQPPPGQYAPTNGQYP